MKPTDKIRIGDRLTIYPRGKKNTYIADFFQNGVHRRVSLKTSNKKVATARATLLAADLVTGIHRQAPPPIDFAAVAEQYIEKLVADGLVKTTLVKYRGHAKRFRSFLAEHGIAKIHGVRAVDFDAWQAERGKVVVPKTILDESRFIKQTFRYCKERKLIAEDPLAVIRLKEPRIQFKPAPSLKDLDAILAAADQELYNWLVMLALTGMRVGELRRLRTEDVDFEGGWVHIVSRPGAETKNKESRKVPMHPRLRRALENLPPRKYEWFYTAKPSPRYPEGGRPIDTSAVNRRLAAVLKRLGLPVGREAGFVVHSLRRFFATFTLHSGTIQLVINRWMGHSDRSVSAVYQALSDGDSQAWMAKVSFGDGAGIPTPPPQSGSAG